MNVSLITFVLLFNNVAIAQKSYELLTKLLHFESVWQDFCDFGLPKHNANPNAIIEVLITSFIKSAPNEVNVKEKNISKNGINASRFGANNINKNIYTKRIAYIFIYSIYRALSNF